MATQVKKVVQGPFTALERDDDGNDLEPGVTFVVDGEEHTILLSELPESVVTRLAVHGISQKVGDSYASAASVEDMTPLAYAKKQIAETIQQLRGGEWRVTVAGGPKATLLARALARVTGRTLEESISAVENLNDEQKKAYRKDPRIVAASAEIKLEDAQKAKERAANRAGQTDAEPTVDLGSAFEG